MTKKETIILEYGDIIQIKSDTNEEIDDNIYLINYIDETKIELIERQGSKLILDIEEGMIRDDMISTIIVLSKSKQKGYARQNNLLPNRWIQIHLGGDVPTIIVGQIKNLEEDQIEIQVFPSDDIIYIDFGYKGIPKDIPIEKIELREKPVSKEEEPVIEEELEELPDVDDEEVEVEEQVVEEEEESIPLRAKIQGILEQSTNFFLSDDAEEIQQEVRVSDDEKRFSIEEQVNDLLDEMLTKIPTKERTTRTMNKLHRILERFSRLRQEFSTKDENNQDLQILKRGKNYRPLLEKLYNLKDIPPWIIPIVKNKKKIYLENKEQQSEYFEDIQPEKLSDVRTKETELINSYYRNENPSGLNKYDYLHKNLNTFFTPQILPDDTSDTITVKKTNQDIETMVNNTDGYLREIFSSVFKENQIKKTRFVINKYNLGTSRLQQLQSGRHGFQLSLELTGNHQRKQITENEDIPIESFLFLNKPFIQYSQVKLPKTTILQKSHLNYYPLLKSYVLSPKTSLNNILIEKYKKHGEEFSGLFNSNTHIKLSSGLLEPSVSTSTEDKYQQFLETILPNNKSIIEDILNSKHNHEFNHLSLYDILKQLEPFHINIDSLYIDDYKTIVSIIEHNIKNIKTTIANNLQEIDNLSKLRLRNDFFKSYIYNIIRRQNDVQLYQNNQKALHGEHIQQWMMNDYGSYLYSLINRNNVELYNVENIDDELIQELERMDSESTESQNKCLNYVLSKKYNSLQDLTNDNNVNIYYDEKYDTTDYDYLNQFENKYNELEPDEFKDLVIENMMYDKNLNYETAELEFNNMMNGRRSVEEGVYAILIDKDEDEDIPPVYYYKRINNVWVLDTSIDNKNYESSKMFCNVKKNCIQLESSDCNEIDNEKKNLEYEKLSKNIQNLSREFIRKQEQYIQEINNNIEFLKERLHRSIQLRNSIYLSSNQYLYSLGKLLDEIDVVISPHEKLRDMILSQPDFMLKMTNLKKFIDLNYVRNANVENDESPFWLYCTETNTKLLPSFYKDLTESFLLHDNYTQELNRICAERGEISDDGDKWVDKYSGYTIRFIDYDTEEGFDTQGFRIQTREVMRDEDDVLVGEVTNEDKLINSPDGILVRKIATSLSQHIGVNLMNEMNFMIKNTLKYTYSSIGPKDVYERRKQHLEEKTGKTMIDYEEKKGELIMLFISFFFLLSIQTHIPSIRTKKTFPGCVRSFDGFPMHEDSEKGLEYIICVVKKLVSNEYPWNTMKRFKPDIIKKNITTLYNKVLIKDSVIQTLIQDKNQYLKDKPEADSEDVLRLTLWNNFMPPLQQFSMQKVMNVADTFEERITKNIRDGSRKQEQKMDLLKSRMDLFSLSVLKQIRNIVKDEKLILHSSGLFYRENSCCQIDLDDRKYNNVLKYFIKKDKDIKKNLKTIRSLNELYSTFVYLSIPYTFINTKNTRQTVEEFSRKQHDEETIYLAFINYCKYNKNLPIDTRLLEVCVRNTSSFSPLDTLQDKISIMKEEGIEYTPEMFYSLLDIINKNNLIENKHYSLREISLLFSLQKYLDKLDYQDNALYKPLQKYMNKIMYSFRYVNEDVEDEVDRTTDIMQYDIQKTNKNMDKLRNYLLKNIERDRNKVKEYITQHAKVKKSTMNKIKTYLDTFMDFEILEDTEYRSSEDSTTIRTRNFIENLVNQLVYDYPNIILNNIKYDESIQIPIHWNLSQFHNQDIKNFIQKSYSHLEPFVDEELLKPILRNIRKRVDIIIEIANRIPHMNLLRRREKTTTPLFNHLFIKEMYEFLYLRIFVEYIDIIEQYADLSSMEKELEGVVVSREEREEEEEEDEILDNDLLEADKLKLKKRVGDLLLAYLKIGMQQKKRINLNKETITELTLRSREKEKDIKTTKLKELTPEERNVDNVLKAAKMGRWNIGLQKGLTQYVQETYDMERSSDEYREIVNLELQFMGENVVPENENIIRDELMEQQMSDHLIDMEANDMSYIPDDDDYGDMDGDEHFY